VYWAWRWSKPEFAAGVHTNSYKTNHFLPAAAQNVMMFKDHKDAGGLSEKLAKHPLSFNLTKWYAIIVWPIHNA